MGHSRALRPVKHEADVSFMGEHKDMQEVTFGDLKGYLHTVVKDVIDYMRLGPTQENAVTGTGTITGITSRVGNPSSSAPGAAAVLIDQTGSSDNQSLHEVVAAAPPPGTVIPRLPSKVSRNERWKIIIRDWDFPDWDRGLLIPLKDWPHEWKNHPAFAMNYFNRRIVAEEFIDK